MGSGSWGLSEPSRDVLGSSRVLCVHDFKKRLQEYIDVPLHMVRLSDDMFPELGWARFGEHVVGRAMRSGDVRGSAGICQGRHEVVRGFRLYGLGSSLRTIWSSTTACSSDVEDAICICSPKSPMRVSGNAPGIVPDWNGSLARALR